MPQPEKGKGVAYGSGSGSSGSPHRSGGGGGAGALVTMPTPDRNAVNGMGEFILTQVRRGASEQQWSDWLKVPFEHACLSRDMSTIKRLLEAGVNGPYDRPRDPRWRRHTLLHLSAACGNTEVMNMLLRWGSSPDVACREPGDKAYTPLHRAALGGHGEAARVLIKAGADKDAKTGGSGASALHLAARKGHDSCVRTLILTGADKDSRRTLDGATPLHQAAFFGQMGSVRELLGAVADPNAQDAEGCTPIFLAAQEGHEEVVVDLLHNGATPDLSREDGWTPLHAAARFGHATTALALLEEGRAELDAITGDHGSTALHVAAISGFDEVVMVLLDVGSDMERRDSGGWTPLHCACAAARVSCVNALIGRGADPLAMTPEGERPSALIGTDLAEGEEPNNETNQRIRNMLRVSKSESEGNRRRRMDKNAAIDVHRPPPPYNDRPPPAYGPDSVASLGMLLDSAASGSPTGSASGSFSGSGSRQLHRSPTAPQGGSGGGNGTRRGGGPHSNGHHRGDVNGGGGVGGYFSGDRNGAAATRSPGEEQHQQHLEEQRYQQEQKRRVRGGVRDGGAGDRDMGGLEERQRQGEGGDAVGTLGSGGYNPKTERPSTYDQRLSTGGVVGGLTSSKGGAAKAKGGTRSPVKSSESQQQQQRHLQEEGLRRGSPRLGNGGGGKGMGGRGEGVSPRKGKPSNGGTATTPDGGGGRGVRTVDVYPSQRWGGGKEHGGVGGLGETDGYERRAPTLAADGRRSSAGRASGGLTFNSSSNDRDSPSGLDDGFNIDGAAGTSGPGNLGGRSGAGGTVETLVADQTAAYDPFSYSRRDAHSSRASPRNVVKQR